MGVIMLNIYTGTIPSDLRKYKTIEKDLTPYEMLKEVKDILLLEEGNFISQNYIVLKFLELEARKK